MWFEQVLFFLAAAGAIAGALGVVMLRNPFFSVLALVAHLMALAVLFLLLRAEFLAAAQIIVYAGAVMVLYVFVVAYIGGVDEAPFGRAGPATQILGPLFCLALLIEISIAVIGSSLQALDTQGADVGAGFGSPGQFGELLLGKFLIPFEGASFLLLLAAVGAVVLARRRRGLEADDEPGGSARPTESPIPSTDDTIEVRVT
jgi:NADH-quinone oxidoreductase subunit J